MTQEEAQQAAYPLLEALAQHPEDERIWDALWLICGPTALNGGSATEQMLWRGDIADIFEYLAHPKADRLPIIPGSFRR